MPCMGPDCDYARQLGRKVADEILAKMITDHNMMDDHFFSKRAEDQWNKTKESFRDAVIEMFVQDACNGF